MNTKHIAFIAAGLLLVGTAGAKLPAPSDEAKAKSAEAAAKTAHGGKVEAFKLCKSMDQVATSYYANAKKAGKDTKPATATAPCADPGPFVYTPPAAASAPAVTAAAPAAPATPAAPVKK
ncbi:MAG: hypothetical protein IV093_23345 [Rubrivivax sp.]|nr:hypothetical protein [Rubrivivax sp.]